MSAGFPPLALVFISLIMAVSVRILVEVFGLWRICFPPVLVRTGRRLPVQALGRDRVEALSPGLPEIKEKSGIWNLVPVG